MEYGALSVEDLVRACTERGDSAAWEEFIRRFHRLIATAVLRVARRWGSTSPQEIDDLVQDTYVKLCADHCHLLRSFQPSHPDAFFGYLKVVAANLAHDHFKATHSEKRGAGAVTVADDEFLSTAPGPQPSTDRLILLKEMDALLRRHARGPHLERDRLVFWLYFRTGLTASAIAAKPFIGLSTKGVESTIQRLTRLLREEMTGNRGQQRAST
jgi:RNA polymerase sigma-70 factor (ECF subfamily)